MQLKIDKLRFWLHVGRFVHKSTLRLNEIRSMSLLPCLEGSLAFREAHIFGSVILRSIYTKPELCRTILYWYNFATL
jgi:hypothetical protein